MMKSKFVIAVILMSFTVSTFFVGCSNDDDFKTKLIFSKESIDVANSGGIKTVEVLTNSPWIVETDSDWILLDTTEGDKGRFKFEFKVEGNEDGEREGTLSFITEDGQNQDFIVIQEAGNKNDIYVVAEGTGEGNSWDDPTNLDNALQIARSGGSIFIAEGTYKPSTMISGGDSSDERDKTFEVKNNVTLEGGYPKNATEGATSDPSKYPTILSGNNSLYHVVTVSASKSDEEKVTLKNLTITHGKAGSKNSSAQINGLDFRRDYGGGVIIGNADVYLENIDILDNKSEHFVAGLYAFEGADITIEDSRIYKNISTSNVGGLWVSDSKALIKDSEIIANEGGTAAGIHGYPNAEIYMYNSVIADNKGKSYGAGFYLRENSKGVLVNTLIYNNTSSSKNGGGGVMMYNDNEITIISSTITKNNIAGPGGGLYGRKGQNKVSIYNSIIAGNKQKDDGPDIDFYESDVLKPEIKSSVIQSITYDSKGSEREDAVKFNVNAMLDISQDYFVVPIDKNKNSAIRYGLSAKDLEKLGADLNPIVKKEIITKDILHKSRLELKTMGAFINE